MWLCRFTKLARAGREQALHLLLKSDDKSSGTFMKWLELTEQDLPALMFMDIEGGFQKARFEGDLSSVDELIRWENEKCGTAAESDAEEDPSRDEL